MTPLKRLHLYVATAAATYAVLIGGTSAGWLVPEIRIITTVLMAALVIWWLATIANAMDAIDAATIGVVLCVGISTLNSTIPRLSMDAFYASLALAAIFGLSRRLAANAHAATVEAMGLVLAVVGVTLLVVWTSTWLRWADVTNALPPLSLRLPSAPFGHPHDAGLVVGLLLPSAVAIWGQRRLTHAAAISLSLIAIPVLVMSGGRGVWAAAIGATIIAIVAMGPPSQFKRHRRAFFTGSVGLAVALGVPLYVSGLGGEVARRLATTETIAGRLETWNAALQAWGDHPITGTGAGTFQFALQSTDYFQHVVYAPKHADNAYVQMVSELGTVGIVGGVLLAVLIASAWRRRRPSPAPMWAMAFATIAGITANPWALGYCAILIAYWAGASAPFEARLSEAPRWTTAVVVLPLVALAAIPLWSVSAAAVAFDRARVSASTQDRAGALMSMNSAVQLDPQFPLYRRERATLLLEDGRAQDAVGELQTAVKLNQWDDAAWRGLALASLTYGLPNEAQFAASRAVALQGTDPMNYATKAYVAAEVGDVPTLNRALSALVTLAPWASADPTWPEVYPSTSPAQALLHASTFAGDVDVPGLDRRWLDAFLASKPSSRAPPLNSAQEAFANLMRCMPRAALSALDDSPQTNVDVDFWFARAVVGRALGLTITGDLRVVAIGSPAARNEGSPVDAPLVDEAAYSRRPIATWNGVVLPSLDGGRLAWLRDPRAAVAAIRPAGACP